MFWSALGGEWALCLTPLLDWLPLATVWGINGLLGQAMARGRAPSAAGWMAGPGLAALLGLWVALQHFPPGGRCFVYPDFPLPYDASDVERCLWLAHALAPLALALAASGGWLLVAGCWRRDRSRSARQLLARVVLAVAAVLIAQIALINAWVDNDLAAALSLWELRTLGAVATAVYLVGLAAVGLRALDGRGGRPWPGALARLLILPLLALPGLLPGYLSVGAWWVVPAPTLRSAGGFVSHGERQTMQFGPEQAVIDVRFVPDPRQALDGFR
jgi:hypothetical protein